ncbi:T-cell surface antigen CD2-like [Narcine bancroftii]|uniref:T-cell surface antigen CD2-like n=1 Tax=Narcine bancroftii TaxID=1343680 RepID=UPI00383119D9
MVSNWIFSFFLWMAISGWCLTESKEHAVNVYSELGNSVLLNVPDQHPNTYHEVKWFKRNAIIARYRHSPKVYSNFLGRVDIFSNGTLRVDSTSIMDEGKYTVVIYRPNGTMQLTQQIHLHLFEKLSTPVIKITCDTKQKVFMSCEVRGAIPVSFYLNDQQLTEDNAVFSDEGRKATLKNFTLFSNIKTFFCKVENPISKNQSPPKELNCEGSMPGYIYMIFIALGVIGLLIFVRLFYCCITKTNNCHIKEMRICEDCLQK